MLKVMVLFLLLNTSIFADSFALIIAVDGGNLQGTSNDAKAMYKLFKEKKVKYRVKLINSEATKSRILAEFKKIVKQAKPKDKVYLFFSGHGTNSHDDSIDKVLRKKLKNTGALLPHGLKNINYKSLIVIKRDFAPLFRKLNNKQVKTTIMFDSCFSGSSHKESFLKLPKTLTREFDQYPYDNIIFLSSSIKLEKSAESSRHKRGYFSMALTECLKTKNRLNTLRSCIKSKYPFTPTILPKRGKQKIF